MEDCFWRSIHNGWVGCSSDWPSGAELGAAIARDPLVEALTKPTITLNRAIARAIRQRNKSYARLLPYRTIIVIISIIFSDGLVR